MEKLIRRNIWIVVGLSIVLLIAMVVAWSQLLIKPQNVAIAKADAEYKASKTIADRLPTALSEQIKAEDKRDYLKGQLAFFRGRYRHLEFGDIKSKDADVASAALELSWKRWMNEYFNDYGQALRQELVDAANETGVTINTSVQVVAPPKTPEEAAQLIPSNGLLKPTGGALKVSVTGALSNILQFFNRINRSSVLMVVDRDIKLTGFAPETTATFSATPYLLASGPGVSLNASAPAAGGEAGASATGGSPGGYPGGSGGSYSGGSPPGYPGGSPGR